MESTLPGRRHLSCTALTIALLSIAPPVSAQQWQTSLVVYGQLAELSGTTAVGVNSADIDLDAGELLDRLDPAGLMAVRAEREGFAVSANAFYGGLDSSAAGPQAGQHVDIELTKTLLDLAGAVRLSDRFEVLAGARYQSVDAQVTATGNAGAAAADRARAWVDPFLGARAMLPLGESWRLIGGADVGGFGISSDLTWSAFVVVDWSISTRIGLVIGYRALGTDYEKGSGENLFKYDMIVAGPLLGVRFDFQ